MKDNTLAFIIAGAGLSIVICLGTICGYLRLITKAIEALK